MLASPDYIAPTISVPDVARLKREIELGEAAAVAGVYVLFNGDAIVYVGQSGDVAKRCAQHRKEGKKGFDSVAWLPLDDVSERLRLEGILALAHLPSDNQMLALRLSKGHVYEMAYASFRRPSSKRAR